LPFAPGSPKLRARYACERRLSHGDTSADHPAERSRDGGNGGRSDIGRRGDAMTGKGPQARYRANLQGEIDSSALYRALAEVEPNPQIAGIYKRLAAVEEAHAEFWRKRLRGLGLHLPRPLPGDGENRGFLSRMSHRHHPCDARVLLRR
jgi:hypothetical protein